MRIFQGFREPRKIKRNPERWPSLASLFPPQAAVIPPSPEKVSAKQKIQYPVRILDFLVGAGGYREPRLRVKLKIPDKTKNQRIFYAGFFGGAKQPKSEPLPSGASLAAISSKVMVFVPSL